MNLSHQMNLNNKITRIVSLERNVEKMKKRKSSFSKIDKLLEMPEEVYTDTPKITITGFNEMIIENFKGILEYEDYYIRINTSLGIININGFELKLENMTNDDIKVKGKVESIDIERNFDQILINIYKNKISKEL